MSAGARAAVSTQLGTLILGTPGALGSGMHQRVIAPITFLLSGALAACGGSGPLEPGPGRATASDAGVAPSEDAGQGAMDAGTTSSPGDAGTSGCVDVAGDWSPTGLNTCVAPDDACTLTQVGCQVDLQCDNGAFSVSGEAAGDRLELANGANRCTAVIAGDVMTADCQGPDIFNGQCRGDFQRGGRGGGPTDPPEVTDGDGQCSASEACALRCTQGGGCAHTCDAASDCETSCSAGGCRVLCEGSATCDSGCSGGGCTMTCQGSADCDFACSGGGFSNENIA